MSPAASPTTPTSRLDRPRLKALALSWQLLWAAVTAISILSFYVHTVQQSVLRGDSMRQAHRIAAGSPVPTLYSEVPAAQFVLGTIP